MVVMSVCTLSYSECPGVFISVYCLFWDIFKSTPEFVLICGPFFNCFPSERWWGVEKVSPVGWSILVRQEQRRGYWLQSTLWGYQVSVEGLFVVSGCSLMGPFKIYRAENDKLREQMLVKDEQLSSSKSALERISNAVSEDGLTESLGNVLLIILIYSADNQKLLVWAGEAGAPGNGTKDVGNGGGIEGNFMDPKLTVLTLVPYNFCVSLVEYNFLVSFDSVSDTHDHLSFHNYYYYCRTITHSSQEVNTYF